MSAVVVDSSVVAKWIVPETDSPAALQLFREATQRGEPLIVLDLAIAEVANVIWKYQRRGLATSQEAEQYLESLLTIPVRIEPAQPRLRQAFEIARTYDRAVYDALFVALAEELGLTGVTADEPLQHVVHSRFPRIILLRDWSP